MDAVDRSRLVCKNVMMLAEAAFVLPPEVQVVPVAELEPSLAATFTNNGDYAVTRPLGRTPSLVVDRRFAAFIEQFRSPKTIATAIVEFGRRYKLESSALLEGSLPLLARLVDARFLIAADQYERPSVPLRIDEWFGPFRVLGVLGLMEDTEVYKVRCLDETVAVLKIAAPASSGRMAATFAHEAAVLTRLGGVHSPQLHALETSAERPYLAMAWCAGVPILEAATRIRELHTPAELRDLAVAMLEAFAHLHARGVVHGDVHPGNVLCAEGSRITILDYGRSVVRGRPEPGEPRGGLGFYYEPEFVRSNGTAHATAAGERYALAALVYRLIAGERYLAFSLDRATAFRQIERSAPRTFASCGAPPWPEVETILARALAKQPEDRFDSLETFARALRDAAVAPDPLARRKRRPDLRAYASAAMASVGLDSALAHGPREAPTASVTFGAAGIALAALRLSFALDDPELLALADFWSTRAALEAITDGGLRSAELGIAAHTAASSVSLGLSGVHAVRFLVATAAGDGPAANGSLDAFIAAASARRDALDVVSGAGGVLATAALLLDAIDDGSGIDPTRLSALGDRAMQTLWSRLDEHPRLDSGADAYTSAELASLGIAHGWAGMLYATLSWCLATATQPPPALLSRLDELAALREPCGSGSRWRVTRAADEPVRFGPGWCAGSAGLVFLWTAAYATFRDERFLALAREAAWHAWEAAPASTSICCGDAGRAYALLNVYRFDGDSKWLERAEHLVQRAIANGGVVAADPSGRGESLYKGALGIAVLAGDMSDPSRARLPFFERDGVGSTHDAHLA